MGSPKKSHAEHAGILLIGRILATLSEALIQLFMVRILSKADVGILKAVVVNYMAISVIVAAGFPDTVLYYLPAREAGERRAVSLKILKLLLVLGMVTTLLLGLLPLLHWLAPGWVATFVGTEQGKLLRLDPAHLKYLLALALLPLADLPARMLPNLLVAEGRFRASAAVGVVQALGRTVAIVVPLALGLGITVAIAAVTAFGYVIFGVLLYYLWVVYRGAPRSRPPLTYRELIRFGIPLGLTEIVVKINEYVDRYLIFFTMPIVAFAEYDTAAFQIPLITSIAYTVGTAYSPRFVELFRSGRAPEAIGLWRQSITKVALVVLPLTMVFVVGAEEVMRILFTDSYVRGANVFRCYSLCTLGRVASYGVVIVSAGRPRLVLVAAALSLAANLLFSVPLLLIMGFEGPALGTFLGFVVMMVAYVYCIARASGERFGTIFPLGDYLKVLGVTLLACVPAVALKLLSPWAAWINLCCITILILGGFAVLGTLLGLISRDDWKYAGDWLRLKVLR